MKKHNRLVFLFAAALAATAVAGCDSEDDGNDPASCTVTPPAWSAPDFAANAADALALRAQLDNLTGMTMRGAEQETVTVDEVSDLMSLYETGDPSLSSVAHAGFDSIIDDAFADFVAIMLAGPQDLVDDNGGWTPGESGGIFGMRAAGINTGGIEVRQIVDKGLFGGGALYRYALSLTEGTITPETIDAIAAAWGANDALTTDPLADSAGYSFRMGFYADIAQALTDAKAYAADADCTAERDAAIVTVFRSWEQALLARTVFYANAGAEEMVAATTDDQRADSLHELSEGLGLTIGFHGLPHPASGPLAGAGRVITDADIEAIMTALGVNIDDLGASTTGEFVEDPTAFQSGVTEVEAKVMEVYDLQQSDIESFRAPTEG